MDKDLSSRRCSNHWQREAVARCPECGRYFCRECITEHEDRILCASCLKNLARTDTRKAARTKVLFRAFQMLIGVLILWTFFYYIGRTLLLMPDEFHEGAVWQDEES